MKKLLILLTILNFMSVLAMDEKDFETEEQSVFMGSDAAQDIQLGEKKKKSLFSFGFGGCRGALARFLYDDGSQKSFLSHYPPRVPGEPSDRHINGLRRRVRQANVSSKKCKKAQGLIMHPYDWEKNELTGKWEERVPEDVLRLKQVLEDNINCEKVIIKLEAYSAVMMPNDSAPTGDFNGHQVPKELEVLLDSDPKKSCYRTKNNLWKCEKFDDEEL